MNDRSRLTWSAGCWRWERCCRPCCGTTWSREEGRQWRDTPDKMKKQKHFEFWYEIWNLWRDLLKSATLCNVVVLFFVFFLPGNFHRWMCSYKGISFYNLHNFQIKSREMFNLIFTRSASNWRAWPTRFRGTVIRGANLTCVQKLNLLKIFSCTY